MHKYLRSDDFVREARSRFDVLRDDGFRSSVRADHWISYGYDDIEIDVMFDDRDGRVTTTVQRHIAERQPRASLTSLYVAADFGAAQDVKEIARNMKSLGAVLDSQLEALRVVLPVVMGPDGVELVLGCHGR